MIELQAIDDLQCFDAVVEKNTKMSTIIVETTQRDTNTMPELRAAVYVTLSPFTQMAG